MIYSDLIQYKNIWERFSRAFSQDKMPHALLLHGPTGVGKEAIAIELAGLLNCSNLQNEYACGLCSSCKRIRTFQHENVKLVVPLPRNKKLSNKDSSPLNGLTTNSLTMLQEQMKLKGEQPYSRIKLPQSNTILINSIREIRKNITMSIADKGWQVFLIFDAEFLCIPNDTSANALLKILEEPPEKTIFILVTSDVSTMLDTIRSRCQQVYFPPLKSNLIASFLESNGYESKISSIASRISNGDVRIAQSIAKSPDDLNENLKVFINAVFSTDAVHWQKLSDYLGNLKRKNIDDFIAFFRTSEYFMRDLLVFSSSEETSNLVYLHYVTQIEKIASNYPNADWHSCIQILENSVEHVKRNGYLPLMISSMLIELQTSLNGIQSKTFDLHEWLAS